MLGCWRAVRCCPSAEEVRFLRALPLVLLRPGSEGLVVVLSQIFSSSNSVVGAPPHRATLAGGAMQQGSGQVFESSRCWCGMRGQTNTRFIHLFPYRARRFFLLSVRQFVIAPCVVAPPSDSRPPSSNGSLMLRGVLGDSLPSHRKRRLPAASSPLFPPIERAQASAHACQPHSSLIGAVGREERMQGEE
jgi:hypothetical protein